MSINESIFNYYGQRQEWQKLVDRLGLNVNDMSNNRELLREYINLKLMTLGLSPISAIDTVIQTPSAPHCEGPTATVATLAQDLIASMRAQQTLINNQLAPVDVKLQAVLDKVFPASMLPADCALPIKIPTPFDTFQVDRANLAFELCTPLNSNYYSADGNQNFRIPQGVLSNPKSDKRSTVGTFHVCEGGAKISCDKFAVPAKTMAYMLAQALNPPKHMLELPFTATQPENNKAYCWTSVYMTPPAVPGLSTARNQPHMQKLIEVRYFAPGAFVANLGFVEQIFCNRGNPLMSDLMTVDPDKFCGVSCMIVLAPHLTTIKKKECGLPHYDQATPKQRKDGMCWKNENELYNDGKAFKLTYRSPVDGVVITVLADSYFGYSKKEIKTMISFTANIVGFSQEEHAGGCYTSPVYSWGRTFRSADKRTGLYKDSMPSVGSHVNLQQLAVEQTALQPIAKQTITHTFESMRTLLGNKAVYMPDKGYLVDRTYSNVLYMPESMNIELSDRNVVYKHPETGAELTMKVKSDFMYILPNGYQVQLIRHPISNQWMLLGTEQDVTFLFKPASVSGAGKSELSKSVMDAVTSGPFIVKDFELTMKQTEEIMNYDFSKRFKAGKEFNYQAAGRATRHILCAERSLGSVIQLLTPDNEEFNEEYNAWLRSMHPDTMSFVYLIKSRYRTSWGDYNSWKQQFRIDKVNGHNGYALKCQGIEVTCNYLRVGQEKSDEGWLWRNFRLRQDFYPAVRFQNNDDIGVSLVTNGKNLQKLAPRQKFSENRSYKLTSNCEFRYFQRPDDACYPGIDKKCEQDLGRLEGKTFISNFEPMNKNYCENLAEDVMTLEKFTEPMQNVIKKVANGELNEFDAVVISSEFRITDPVKKTRTANVRYLQTRDELLYTETQQQKYLIEMRKRLQLEIPFSEPVVLPVSVYVPGRRLNTVDPKNVGIKPLSVYGPIHYQPIPYLMLDWLASLSGKSPSTTGSGSLEGALTKGPFNNMLMSIDLNYACLALILGNEPVLSTAAGSIGHKLKVEHDITLIIPEIFTRMTASELKIENLIKSGCLEQVQDLVVDGKTVPASILGYRITSKFVKKYFARIFDSVDSLFTEEHLRPEVQSMANYVNGVNFIYENIKSCVEEYYTDGSYEELLPPLKVLFDIVKNGSSNGLTLTSPEFMKMFEREEVIKSNWYQQRLIQAQRNEIALLEKETATLKARKVPVDGLVERLAYVRSAEYVKDIEGSLAVHVFAEDE
ncbi:Conserved_hypothetical protein [Hexamita inflata]|uniref:PPi-type phosphoenolpyruvate carboxykinase lobe 2 domain-containing protein n=1 Tax=Hexamita inflata TaxID=28002 RepID=A0AA86U9E3_9EUKA|nr:Conserved hypothetical protein [Hexamita inflata]